MATAIFGAQFTAIWAAIFALGNSAVAFKALESGRRIQFLVCALTTVLGFGSLVFMAIPAVRSLGVAVSIGVLSSLAATVLFLAPLLLGPDPSAKRRLPNAADAD